MLRRVSAILVATLGLMVLLSGCSELNRTGRAVERWVATRTDITQAEVDVHDQLLGTKGVTVSGQVADAAAAESFIADIRVPDFSRRYVSIDVLLHWADPRGTIWFRSELAKADVAGIWTQAGQPLPVAATAMWLNNDEPDVRYDSSDPVLTATEATGLPGGTITVVGTRLSLQATSEADLRARGESLTRLIDSGIAFTASVPNDIKVTTLADLLPAARTLGNQVEWLVNYEGRSRFTVSTRARAYEPLFEYLVAADAPGLLAAFRPDQTNEEPYGDTVFVNAPSEDWCDDFLTSVEPSDVRLRLSCPIGTSEDRPYATIDGPLYEIIATMPAVRAPIDAGMQSVKLTTVSLVLDFGAEDTWAASIDAIRAIGWDGDRDFAITAYDTDGTEFRARWTSSATSRASDVQLFEGPKPSRPEAFGRLVEAWDSSAAT